jgi:heptosyltransferase I
MTRLRLDPRQIERVLIVKLSSIGDIVHALPVSAALGDAFPHWRLTWIVEERSAPVLEGNPYLHDIIVLPQDWHARPWTLAPWRQWLALRRRLQARHFDLAIDLQGLSRSALIAFCSGARVRLGYSYLREIAPLLLHRVPREEASRHCVDQILDVARFLGASVASVRFPLHIPPADDAEAARLLHEAGVVPDQPFVAINPTDGGYGHKGIGVERCRALIRALRDDPGVPVVLVGGIEDRANGAAITLHMHPPPANLIGRTTLKQLAALLRRTRLHVTGDTGSAHMAAALRTPVVCVFGRTNPARSAPYGQDANVIHHREQCAGPCRRFRARAPLNCDHTCLAAPPRCLAAVSVEEIVAAVRRCWRQMLASQSLNAGQSNLLRPDRDERMTHAADRAR